SKGKMTDPPGGPNWFRPEPFFARDVKDWKAGEPIVLGDDAISFPAPLSKTKPGAYHALAIMDFNRGGTSFGTSEGNGYSADVPFDVGPTPHGPIKLVIDQIYHEKPFKETDHIKLVDIDS